MWRLPAADMNQAAAYAAQLNISLPLVYTLLNRGLSSHDEIADFLFTSFEKEVTHASHLKDATQAVDRIIQAITRGEKILIFGDYDVDGITSSALMMLSLLPLSAAVNFFLPHRVRDGYGLSVRAIERAAANGYTLVITVDNGITAFAPAIKARELGIDLIITDHHKPHDHLPDAYAIVNPHQHTCEYPFKGFAGVGVTFKIISLLYEKMDKLLPAKVYELLLLGTIADVVPLVQENRFWVRHCLQQVNAAESIALQVLKTNGKVTRPTLSASDIGFSIAPQINALGRLEDPRQGVTFLIGSDAKQVEQVGRVLRELNEARRTIERAILESVQQLITNKTIDLEKERIIIASSDTWPPGVIGLVASRLVALYGRPTLLFHVTQSGVAKGSCRSIAAFNMFDALSAHKELLEQFGGHAQAAGLSLKVENIPRLKEALEHRIAQQLTAFDLQQKLSVDAYVHLTDFNQKFMHDMSYLEPFGHAHQAPLFLIEAAVLIQKPVLLKEAHVKCAIFADGVVKSVIFFNRPELFSLLSDHQDPFKLVAHVVENHWNGRINIELQGIDIAL